MMKMIAGLVLTFASGFSAQATTEGFSIASKMIHLPRPLSIEANGEISFDPKSWTMEKEADGTELFTAKLAAKKTEAKAAATKSSDGKVDSFASYELNGDEKSEAMFFDKGDIKAATSCEDTKELKSIGRVCVTATPKLCQTLKAGDVVTPEILKEMESFEMKALALILTLRGSDHQLDNLARAGNRLGLKTALQTTRGQLVALAQQVTRESNHDKVDAKVAKEAETAKLVIEKSLPRLKQACLDTKFN